MQKSKRKNNETPLRVFEPTKNVKLVNLGAITLHIISFAWVSTLFPNQNFPDANIFQIASWLTFCSLVCFFLIHDSWIKIGASLRIHSDGIEYRSGKRSLCANWDDLYQIRWITRGQFGYVAIESRLPLKINSIGLERYLPFRWGRYRIPLTVVEGIETKVDGCFGKRSVDFQKLKETEFGSLMYEYAPHLFEENVS